MSFFEEEEELQIIPRGLAQIYTDGFMNYSSTYIFKSNLQKDAFLHKRIINKKP